MASKLLDVTINHGTATVRVNYQTSKQLRLQVIRGQYVTNYVIKTIATVPLTFGNGQYQFILCEQQAANRYRAKARVYKTVSMSNVLEYALHANDYVPFDENSSFYAMAKELGTWNQLLMFLQRSFAYDYIGAILKARKSFSPPDLETCYKTHKGTCYELAALLVAMARINQIPAQLVVGTANGQNHAWVELDDDILDPTAMVTRNQKHIKYVPQRYY